MSRAPSRTRARARRALGALAAALALAALPSASARAASPYEVIAGWEGDTHVQGYGFLTLGAVPATGERLRWPVRLGGSFLYYDYDSTGTTITVRSPGVSLLGGVRWAAPHGSFTLMAGAEGRREHRDNGGLVAVDGTLGVVGQAEGEIALDRRDRFHVLANYSGAARYLYGRAALRRQLNDLDWSGATVWFAGIEGVGQGNDESDAAQGGAFAECALVHQHASIGLHAGYKDSGSPGGTRRHGAYLGLGWYQAL